MRQIIIHSSALIVFTFIMVSMAEISTESQKLINTNPDPNGEPWVAGGISEDQWNKSLSGVEELTIKRSILSKSMTVPTKVNNTRYSSFRPVFNQLGGSCAQASGIGYIYTYEINSLRGLASNVPQNQYPYDFTYNFINNGDSTSGSITISGWDIVKALGIPNAKDYGGFGLGRFTQWISGYDIYYGGMSNRLKNYFTMTIQTAADIDKMKQWLYDRGNGSSEGGCLSFGADAVGLKIVSLATGTPDAGKKALIAFGNSGGHAMTIAGYNDEIRYDFNNDHQYTNNIDLNGDNIIDVRDWEIGAVLMVNSWGNRWQDSGKVYVMYKVLAESKANGGIYNNQLAGINVDQKNTSTSLTCKVKLSHNVRKNIRIKVGYSTLVSATKPAVSKYFAEAFYNAGGAFPMQGINSNPIEIGLDLSDYASATAGKPAAFFLQIISTDNIGTIQKFSLIDYSGTAPVEYFCLDSNISITTGITTLKIVKPATLAQTPPTAVSQFVSNKGFKRDKFTIKNNVIFSQENISKTQILRLNGSPVNMRKKVRGQSGIDISSLPSGAYIIRDGDKIQHFVKSK